MRTPPVVDVKDPNQTLGESLGTKSLDADLTPKQAEELVRDQMAGQTRAMVRASIIQKRKDVAMAPESVAAAAILGLAEVSVQE